MNVELQKRILPSLIFAIFYSPCIFTIPFAERNRFRAIFGAEAPAKAAVASKPGEWGGVMQ